MTLILILQEFDSFLGKEKSCEIPFSDEQLQAIYSYLITDEFLSMPNMKLRIQSTISRKLNTDIQWFKMKDSAEILDSLDDGPVILTSVQNFAPIDFFDFSSSQHAAFSVYRTVDRLSNNEIAVSLDPSENWLENINEKQSPFALGNHLFLPKSDVLKESQSLAELFTKTKRKYKIDAYHSDIASDLSKLNQNELLHKLRSFKNSLASEYKQQQVLNSFKELLHHS